MKNEAWKHVKRVFYLFIFLIVALPSHWWHPVTWQTEGHGNGTGRNKERVWFYLFFLPFLCAPPLTALWRQQQAEHWEVVRTELNELTWFDWMLHRAGIWGHNWIAVLQNEQRESNCCRLFYIQCKSCNWFFRFLFPILILAKFIFFMTSWENICLKFWEFFFFF